MSDVDARIEAFLAELERALEEQGMPARDVVAEAREHLRDDVRESERKGVRLDAAVREALERFGSVNHVVGAWRERALRREPPAPRDRLFADLGGDLRYALRKLKASPGFAIATLLTLAIGIGATTVIFSLVSGVLLRPLPFREPDRLIRIALTHDWGEGFYTLSPADFATVRELTQTLDGVSALYVRGNVQVSGGDEPIRITGGRATADFFSTLGVSPILGRTFLPGEDQPGRERVVVVSHRFWRGYLKSNPEILGRALAIDGIPHTVVGVLPPEFRWTRVEGVDLWPILVLDIPPAPRPFYLIAAARLKPGVTRRQTEADLRRIEALIKARSPESPDDWAIALQDMRDYLVGRSRPALLLLFGSVGLLLLIACANVANVLLARALGRQQEMATRLALGASAWRLVRQLVVESFILATAGGVVGVALAAWSLGPLVAWGGDTLSLPQDVNLDYRVFAFAAALVVLVTGTVGLVPALRSLRTPSSTSLKEAATTVSASRGARWWRSAFAAIETCLATILLVAAGLVFRSLLQLQSVETGLRVDPERVLTMSIALPEPSYPQDEHVVGFWKTLLERIRSVPGVVSAACSMSLPPDRLILTNPFSIEGSPIPPGQTPPQAEELLVSPGYFEALGIPLREGRDLAPGDSTDSSPVLLVNQSLVEKYFPGRSPLGHRLKLGDPSPQAPWYTVVGVVSNVKYAGLDAPPAATVYVSYFQKSWWRDMYLVVRAASEPASIAPVVRAHVSALDGKLASGETKTLARIQAEAVAAPRFRTGLLSGFAAIALTLAALGVYGVLAHAVASRTHEIAIRRAVGASDGRILTLVLAEGLSVVLVGASVGVLGSLALSRLVSGLLFQVSPADPITIVGAPVLLTLVGALACLLPARRALGIDPFVALKTE